MDNRFRSKVSLHYKKLLIILIFLWFISLYFLVSFSYRKISSGIKKELGNKAMLVAIDMAEKFKMDEEEYDRLASLSFHELLKDKANAEFEKRARNIMNYSDIRYIYILSSIPESRVKYVVEKGEKELYHMPEGSPLDAIYLLDAAASYDVRLQDTNWAWYRNKDRYTTMCKENTLAYERKKPGYYISGYKKRTYLTGHAPVYLSNGKYIGIVGVDLYMDQYLSLIKSNLHIIQGFILTNIVIGILTMYLLIKINKSDKEMRERTILAYTDCLTSTLNRHGFMEALQKQWDKCLKERRVISLLFVDLDFFKQYNDNYGHLAGDENLRRTSLLLTEKTQSYGGVVGRYGGDEFVILLSDINYEKAQKLSDEILSGMHESCIKHEHSEVCHYQTVSIGGVTILPSNKISTEALMNYADMALYEAKKIGRNKAVIYSKIEAV